MIELLRDRMTELYGQSISFMAEPIEEWRSYSPCKINMLQEMYQDPLHYSFPFQLIAMVTKVNQLQSNVLGKMVERSLESQRRLFIPLLREQGHITQLQNDILDDNLELLSKSTGVRPDMYIYLRTDPEVVFRRIAVRGRPEEKDISLDYIRRLHELHESWLIEEEKDCPVITINANQEVFPGSIIWRLHNECVARNLNLVEDISY